MCILETDRGSITGKILYSDIFLSIPGKYNDRHYPSIREIPHLTRIAQTPILGPIGGIARIGLSIIHIIGHVFAAAFTWNKGHLFHAAKGGTELLRGMIETLPIFGRIFCMYHDADWVCSLTNDIPDVNGKQIGSFFIVKIYNPKALDNIDKFFGASYILG